jgi:hypothetical protein
MIMKPNINDVYDAFRIHTMNVVRINNLHASREVWTEEVTKACLELKAKLTELGLAEHIDWTEKL